MNDPRKALVVGINDYSGAPLESCVSDAVKISRLLESHSDGRPNFETRNLLSSQVKITKSLLKEEIDNLFSGDPSISLLYFAGHGDLNSYGGYLVTPDYKPYDEGVEMEYIVKRAINSEAKNKIIILDCCYSGSFALPQIKDNKISELCDGLTILTSCRNNEIAKEKTGGIFSSLLIDALEGQCADLTGNILPSSIYAYIDRALGNWGGQRPIFKTNVSRFVSLRSTEPPVDLSVLRNLTKYFKTADTEYLLSPSHEFTHPEADDIDVKEFKELQKLESIGLVVPVGEEHMYFAAINSKSCMLTTLGRQYWNLIHSGKI